MAQSPTVGGLSLSQPAVEGYQIRLEGEALPANVRQQQKLFITWIIVVFCLRNVMACGSPSGI